MRLAVVANVIPPTDEGSTTLRIAARALRRGHEVHVTSPGNFSLDPDEQLRFFARSAPAGEGRTPSVLQRWLDRPDGPQAWIDIDDIDVLLLRNNPSVQSAWARNAAIEFGRFAKRRGVVVLNDPDGLSRASNKLYFQTFPERVRPRTLITRNIDRIAEFVATEGTVILKPLSGSGGRSVFVLRSDDPRNIPGIIQAVTRDGYVVAQEYLPRAVEGDTRLFLMNGVPLEHRGKIAAVRRVRTGHDLRSNVHAGGRIRRARVEPIMLELAEVVRPRLVEDGMFLVGLDIVGDRLMEINVFSPGGLGSVQKFEGVDFTDAVVDSLERKVEYAHSMRRKFDNRRIATL